MHQNNSIEIKAFQQKTSSFYMEVALLQSYLSICLKDLNSYIIYKGIYTDESKKQINPSTSFEDIFNSLSLYGGISDEQLMEMVGENKIKGQYFDYKFGNIIEKNGSKCYKIQSQGRITIYKPMYDMIQKKQIIFQSKLKLQKMAEMCELQILIEKINIDKIENQKKFIQLQNYNQQIYQNISKIQTQILSFVNLANYIKNSDIENNKNKMERQLFKEELKNIKQTIQKIKLNRQTIVNNVQKLEKQNNTLKEQSISQKQILKTQKQQLKAQKKQWQNKYSQLKLNFQSKLKTIKQEIDSQTVQFKEQFQQASKPHKIMLYQHQPQKTKFKVTGKKLQYIGQTKLLYSGQIKINSFFIFNEQIPLQTIYNFKIKILKSPQQSISIGVIQTGKLRKPFLQNQIQYDKCSYASFNGYGYIFPLCEVSGEGFKEGQIVVVSVDRKKKYIQWCVLGEQRASCYHEELGMANKNFMPFVEIQHKGDRVQWC